MKNNLLFLLAFFAFGSIASAQLANWKDINATDFPTDISPQINGYCRIVQLKFHNTNPNKYYAVTSEGGLFISEDAAANWTVAPGMESKTASCASVCVDRTNDQIIYLGTGDPNYYSNGAGVYKSTDGGATFTATSLTNCLVIEILQHPTDPNIFVAATNKGIYQTTNSGTTWTAKTATNINFSDLQQNAAANSQILYASTRENAPRYYRSTDFGSTWTQITSGIVAPSVNVQAGSRIAVTPADPNVVYFSEVGGGGMVFKSTDGGLNFTLQKNQGAPYLTFYDDDPGSSGQGNYNNVLFADRNDPSKIWLQSHNTWFSDDSGVTWTMLSRWSTILHTDHHQIVQSPYDANKLYSCNDGGVWLSTNGGASWTPKSNGLYAFEIATNAGKSSHTDPSFVSIGTQDNGLLYRTATKWYTTVGGDDYDKREFDYLPNGGYWYNLDDNKRTKVPNAGTATYGIPTATLQAIGFNRTNTELGFLGNQDIYRTSNLSAATPTWTQISSFNKTIMAIHSSIANPDRLYVITNDQLIYVSTNATTANPTFTSYALPSASNSTASIAAICNNADIVYIAINAKVYRSADGGQTWVNADAGANLPAVNHRRILAEEFGGTEELVFVATNNAVYYKKNNTGNWINYSTNLPSRRSPTDFSIFDDGTNRARIRYATYGRAIWETDFSNLRVVNPSFVADHTNDLCQTGGVVHFTDLSLGGPTAWSWSFPGGTPSTSTLQNPTVTYSTPGTYSVTLTITVGMNNYTVTQSNYITAPTVIGGGTYSVGTGGDFTTLTAAVNYWNANCINGPVVFNLTNATYPSETFPLTINSNGLESTLTIKPTGTSAISGSAATALFILNGVDWVTIDGSNGSTANTVCPPSAASRNLTITNNNTGTSSAVIWLQSTGNNGATHNTIKNCNLVGNANTTTLFGIGSGNSTIGTGSFGVGNNNNSFVNNSIQKAQYGIYSGGAAVTNKNTGTIINQNIMNAASPNNILRTGILVKYEDNILISGNTIGNTNVQNNTGSMGIACGGEISGSLNSFSGNEVTGATITYNNIDNIVRAQSFGSAAGIFIASVNSTTGSGPNLIANNSISRILAPTAAAVNYAAGITIGGGRNSDTRLYYNSINLTGTQSNNIQTFGVMIGGGESYAIVDMRDNIIVNQSVSTNRNYVIGLGWGGNYPRLFLNYNDYYKTGAHFAVVGGLDNSPAGDKATFADWKTETDTDVNSKNVLPEFISATNLHLNTSGANNLAHIIGTGTAVPVVTDIDCEARYSNPDMGADENCINPTVPSLSATQSAICSGSSTTLSITTGNLNKATEWHWYTGSCGGVAVGTGTSISVSPISTTTYYARGEGGCVTPGTCGSITITVNMPSTTITGPAAVCSAQNATLDAGAGFSTYAWSNSGGNSQMATYNNLTTTSTFNVTVSDAIGCTTSATKTVTVNPLPTPAISGNTTICLNQSTQLTATGGDSYSWNTGATSASITVNPTTNTTYTVTASTAQSCTATATVQVVVNPLPVMGCPMNMVVLADDPAFALTGGTPSGGAYSGPGVSAGMFDPATAGVGTHNITYAYTDGNTCSNNCLFTITVNSSAMCPDLSAAPANVAITNSTCNSNCIATGGLITAPGGLPCPAGSTLQYQVNGGSWSTTLPVYDQDGPAQSIKTRCNCDLNNANNSPESAAALTIPADCTDNTAPSITCPANIVASAASQCAAVVNYTAPVGTDNCAGATTVQTAGLASGASFPAGTTTNTFRVTDASGNSSTCAFTVTVTDAEAPSITCPANIVASAASQCAAVVNYTAPVGTDNCAGATTAQTAGLASGASFPAGTTTNTFRVTDASGNSSTCAFTVTVTDAEAPSITCPANIVASAASQCAAVVNYTAPVGTDNCAGATTVQTAGLASGASFPAGTTTNTFRVTDASGNSSTCAFTVTVTDAEAPSITCPANIVASAASQCAAVVNYTAPVGTDNCAGATTAQTAGLVSGASFPAGTTTNTFRVTDASGNSSTCAFTVTVTDAEAPSITCPANIVASAASQCAAVVNYTAPVGTDNCAGATTAQTAGLASGASFPAGTTTNTFRVTDASGNSSTCAFTVTVTDAEAPSITCPANIVASAASQCAAVVNYTAPVGTDNCAGATTVQTAGLASGASFPAGTTTNTFRVTDASGNSSTCAFTVTVTDAEAPSITCPANIVASAASQCAAVVNYTAPVGTDNCAGATTAQTAGLASGASFPAGTTTNTFRVTDASGNSSTCAFTVTVTDAQAPSITCPANIVANATSQCAAVVNYTAPVGTDNCAGATTIQTAGLASGSSFPAGTTTNTFKVTDASGNSSTCAFTVTVTDAQVPTIVCPANQNLIASTNCSNAIGSWSPVSVNDNCTAAGSIVITQTPPPTTVLSGHNASTLVTLTANDGNGNTSSCSFTVTLKDLSAPVAKCKNGTVNLGINGTVTAAPAVADNGSTDNCAFTLSLSPNIFTCANIGLNTVTLKATDAGGNTATCTAKITVQEVTPPTALCKNPTVFLSSTGHATLTVAQVDNGSTDACGIASMTLSQTEFNCSELQGSTWPVSLSMKDLYGNTSSCMAQVTVKDKIQPAADCKDVTVQLGSNGKATVYGAILAASSTDNCSIWSYSPSAKVYTAANIGDNNLSITVKDWGGNAATCTSVVTVIPFNNTQDFSISDKPWVSSLHADLRLYPNPTDNETTVSFDLPAEQTFQLQLLDMAGRMVYSQEAEGVEGENSLLLRLNGLAPGVYVVNFQTNGVKTQRKLVLQR